MRITSDKGIYFSWNFHDVAAIAVDAPQKCSDFVTRRIFLIDVHGERVPITCFSPKDHGGEIPVIVEHAAEDAA